MGSKVSLSLAFLFVCWATHYTDAVRCFSCDGCRDPFYPALDHIQECKNGGLGIADLSGLDRPQRCVKIVAADGSVQRGCGASRSGLIGCERSLEGTVCTCFTDLCNKGSQTSSKTSLILLGFIFLSYIFHF